jgi:sRNA-binding carbon storage regulator CsrA
MTVISRHVDQWLLIGQDIRVSPTDIDQAGVRLVARGRVLGGPEDGATFDTRHELAVGQQWHIGPHVVVTLVEVRGDTARLGVLAPAHIDVQTKEHLDHQQRGSGGTGGSGGRGSHGK